MSSQSKLWILSNSIFFCYEVVEVGDDISAVEDSEAVLLCNHQSTADTPLIMIVLWPKGMCSGKVMWIMDHIFRFTHFGLMSTIRNDFFIRQVSLWRLISYKLSALWLSLLFFGYIIFSQKDFFPRQEYKRFQYLAFFYPISKVLLWHFEHFIHLFLNCFGNIRSHPEDKIHKQVYFLWKGW